MWGVPCLLGPQWGQKLSLAPEALWVYRAPPRCQHAVDSRCTRSSHGGWGGAPSTPALREETKPSPILYLGCCAPTLPSPRSWAPNPYALVFLTLTPGFSVHGAMRKRVGEKRGYRHQLLHVPDAAPSPASSPGDKQGPFTDRSVQIRQRSPSPALGMERQIATSGDAPAFLVPSHHSCWHSPDCLRPRRLPERPGDGAVGEAVRTLR